MGTERDGYYAEQNARSMAHAIVNNPEIKSLTDGFEYFCMCINEQDNRHHGNADGSYTFHLKNREFTVQSDGLKLDPMVETLEEVLLETYYKLQA